MFRKSFLLLFFSASAVTGSFAQDIITMLNGRAFEAKVKEVTEEEVRYETVKKDKIREQTIDSYRVFSITYSDGRTDVLYRQDTLAGNFFTVEEMQYFVLGEQDAHKYYKAPFATVSGFVLGATGGFLLADSYLIILVPFIATGIHVIPGTDIQKQKVSDPKLADQQAYREGYRRVVRNKRITNALKGSVVGVLAGYATYKAIGNTMDRD